MDRMHSAICEAVHDLASASHNSRDVGRAEEFPALNPNGFQLPVRLDTKQAKALAIMLERAGQPMSEQALARLSGHDDGAVPVYWIRHVIGLTIRSEYVKHICEDGTETTIAEVFVPILAARAYLQHWADIPDLIGAIRCKRTRARRPPKARQEKQHSHAKEIPTRESNRQLLLFQEV